MCVAAFYPSARLRTTESQRLSLTPPPPSFTRVRLQEFSQNPDAYKFVLLWGGELFRRLKEKNRRRLTLLEVHRHMLKWNKTYTELKMSDDKKKSGKKQALKTLLAHHSLAAESSTDEIETIVQAICRDIEDTVEEAGDGFDPMEVSGMEGLRRGDVGWFVMIYSNADGIIFATGPKRATSGSTRSMSGPKLNTSSSTCATRTRHERLNTLHERPKTQYK